MMMPCLAVDPRPLNKSAACTFGVEGFQHARLSFMPGANGAHRSHFIIPGYMIIDNQHELDVGVADVPERQRRKPDIC